MAGLRRCGASDRRGPSVRRTVVVAALGVPHNVACPSALIGASNFFELAVAAAIALFGFQSGAALATVVGVLVEVPVMLSVVRIVLWSRGWYHKGVQTTYVPLHNASRNLGRRPGNSRNL